MRCGGRDKGTGGWSKKNSARCSKRNGRDPTYPDQCGALISFAAKMARECARGRERRADRH